MRSPIFRVASYHGSNATRPTTKTSAMRTVTTKLSFQAVIGDVDSDRSIATSSAATVAVTSTVTTVSGPRDPWMRFSSHSGLSDATDVPNSKIGNSAATSWKKV